MNKLLENRESYSILAKYYNEIDDGCGQWYSNFKDDLGKPCYLTLREFMFKHNETFDSDFSPRGSLCRMMTTIADVGFVIDVCAAIDDPFCAQIVIFSGVEHMLELQKNLFKIYKTKSQWYGLSPHGKNAEEIHEKYSEFANYDLAELMLAIDKKKSGPYTSALLPTCWEDMTYGQFCRALGCCSVCQKINLLPLDEQLYCGSCGTMPYCSKECQTKRWRCACLAITYCSKECQVKDWPTHKPNCKAKKKC